MNRYLQIVAGLSIEPVQIAARARWLKQHIGQFIKHFLSMQGRNISYQDANP
jgi:hypothetical protein